MKVQNQTEAFFIATEMEKRAIRMYERMSMLFDEADTQAVLKRLLLDEQTHLGSFMRWLDGQAPLREDALILSAEASGILFPGGLTEALRHGAASSAEAVRLYAVEQEETAVRTYRLFAAQCDGEAKQAFLSIADEEENHLRSLKQMERPQA